MPFAARSRSQSSTDHALALPSRVLPSVLPVSVTASERAAEMVRGCWHLREAERCFGLAMPLRGAAYAAARCEALRDVLQDYDESEDR